MSERGVIVGEVYDAKVEARRIIADAERAREEARVAGYAAGVAEARREVAEKLSCFERERAAAIDAVAVEAVEIALAVAKRVVRRELAESSVETARALARELLDDLKRKRGIELRVNPRDAAAVRGLGLDARVVDDTAVEPGGCVLVGETFRADAGVETQIAVLAEVLRGKR